MSRIGRRVFVGLLVLGGLASVPRQAWAAARQQVFDPDANYSITYELNSGQATTVESAKIRDTVMIGSKEFLLVEVGSAEKKRAYINLEAVRIITQR